MVYSSLLHKVANPDPETYSIQVWNVYINRSFVFRNIQLMKDIFSVTLQLSQKWVRSLLFHQVCHSSWHIPNLLRNPESFSTLLSLFTDNVICLFISHSLSFKKHFTFSNSAYIHRILKELNKIQILDIFIELDFNVFISWKGSYLTESVLKERMYQYDPLHTKFCYIAEERTTPIFMVLDITYTKLVIY